MEGTFAVAGVAINVLNSSDSCARLLGGSS